MALKTNNLDNVPEGTQVDATSSAGSGDAITRIVGATGAPTGLALAAAGLFGRGMRVVAADGETDNYSFTQTASLDFTNRCPFKVDSTRRPTVNPHTMYRQRSSGNTNVWKLVETTAGVIQIQNALGSPLKSFNSAAAPADGYHYAMIFGTVGSTTATGTLTAELYRASDDTLVDSFTASNVNLGTVGVTQLQWGKPESAGTVSKDFDSPAFNTGTAARLSPETPPVITYTKIKGNTAESAAAIGDAVDTTNSGTGTAGDAFNLVQATGASVKFDADAVNGTKSYAFAQAAGSTAQAVAYWTWSGSAAWLGASAMVQLSKIPDLQFNLFRFFSDAAYATPEAQITIRNDGKLASYEEGQAQVVSSGSLAGATWYCMQMSYRVSTNTFTVTFYQRGNSTVVATASVTLSSAAALNSMRFGIGSAVVTGGLTVRMDDLEIGRNGIPARTDLNEAPTITASNTSPKAGETVILSVGDADGTIASVAFVGSGPTIQGTGNTRWFVAPPVAADTPYTVRVTDNAGATANVSLTVKKAPYRARVGGVWLPGYKRVTFNGMPTSDRDGLSIVWAQDFNTDVAEGGFTTMTTGPDLGLLNPASAGGSAYSTGFGKWKAKQQLSTPSNEANTRYDSTIMSVADSALRIRNRVFPDGTLHGSAFKPIFGNGVDFSVRTKIRWRSWTDGGAGHSYAFDWIGSETDWGLGGGEFGGNESGMNYANTRLNYRWKGGPTNAPQQIDTGFDQRLPHNYETDWNPGVWFKMFTDGVLVFADTDPARVWTTAKRWLLQTGGSSTTVGVEASIFVDWCTVAQ